MLAAKWRPLVIAVALGVGTVGALVTSITEAAAVRPATSRCAHSQGGAESMGAEWTGAE